MYTSTLKGKYGPIILKVYVQEWPNKGKLTLNQINTYC